MSEPELPMAVARRLASTLEQVPLHAPLPSQARYNLPARPERHRVRPAVFLAAATVAAYLLATLATGSPSPVTWTEQAVSVIKRVEGSGRTPDLAPTATSPKPASSPSTRGVSTAPPPVLAVPAPALTDEHGGSTSGTSSGPGSLSSGPGSSSGSDSGSGSTSSGSGSTSSGHRSGESAVPSPTPTSSSGRD